MKILSPAGNAESLKAAVFNGADEVYLGINEFNARNNIDGFNIDNLEKAVDFAHLYGVKVNLAINILFSDSELQSALNTVVKAYNMGVDSFIIQDLGLIKLVCQSYPEIVIHASTQMAVHNLEGVRFLEKYGIKRVVLARETPLEEIERIKNNSDIEIEYFAHGALCVCFSGNCYISSYLHGASGNRGRCKQLCRLNYTLFKNGVELKKGPLFSAKDFDMSDKLCTLEKAGVSVLKIEGRARRPYYVGAVTKEYRKAIDGLSVDKKSLQLAFNRGFTQGYFNGNGEIISEYHNHVGVCVGKVEKVNNGKKFNQVYIWSNDNLSPRSTFKFFDNGSEKTTLSAYDLKKIDKNKYVITTTQKIEKGWSVNLIVDEHAEKELLERIKKVPIKISVCANLGENIVAIFTVNGKKYTVFGDVLQTAQSSPLSYTEIAECFKKNDIFDAQINLLSIDNVFITKSKLNAFRREVFEKAESAIIGDCKHNLHFVELKNNDKAISFIDFKYVYDVNDKFDRKNIIFSPDEYTLKTVDEFLNKCKKIGVKGYLDLPNFALEKDILLLKDIVEKTAVPVVANNYYALGFNTEIVIGAGLNVYNCVCASELGKQIITAESDIAERIDFPYMTLRHCPLKNQGVCDCKNCKYSNDYYFKNDSGKIFKLKRKKLSTCTFYLVD